MELKEGPCITCMQSQRPTVSGSLGSDSRWPHFGGRVARMGVHSVLALPLMVGDRVIGAINTYAYRRDAFAEHAVALGFAVRYARGGVGVQRAAAGPCSGTHAAAAARVGQPGGDRSGDRDHPQPVGRQPEEAFERLTQISQSENIKLYVVAERLVEEAVRRARARHQR